MAKVAAVLRSKVPPRRRSSGRRVAHGRTRRHRRGQRTEGGRTSKARGADKWKRPEAANGDMPTASTRAFPVGPEAGREETKGARDKALSSANTPTK